MFPFNHLNAPLYDWNTKNAYKKLATVRNAKLITASGHYWEFQFNCRNLLDSLKQNQLFMKSEPCDYSLLVCDSRLVRDPERYYHMTIREDVASWNLRERHMADTIDHISPHLAAHHEEPKLVVWTHNSHVGNARATDIVEPGILDERQGSNIIRLILLFRVGSSLAEYRKS